MSASKWLRERDAKYRRDGWGPGAAHWQALLDFLDGAFGEATPSTDSESYHLTPTREELEAVGATWQKQAQVTKKRKRAGGSKP